jgi:hypothetical protein
MSLEVIRGDRRSDRRYELTLDLRFFYTASGSPGVGHGASVDLSRSGILFQTDDPPPPGSEVEIRLNWPFLLQAICPLDLVMRGTVLYTCPRGTVLRAQSYEFQTAGERSFAQVAPVSRLSTVA